MSRRVDPTDTPPPSTSRLRSPRAAGPPRTWPPDQVCRARWSAPATCGRVPPTA